MNIFRMIGRRIILLFFIAVGCAFIFLGYKVFMHGYDHMEELKNKNSNYVDVMATIVGHNENNKRMQAVIVEYEVNGVKYKKISDVYTNNYQEVGTQVKIKYNPSNPDEVIWKDDISKNDIVIMAAGGVIMFFGGTCSLFNFFNLFKPDPVRRYVNRRPINNVVNNMNNNTSYDNRSLTDIAMEKRVGVFDPNQGTTSPYVQNNDNINNKM